MTLSQLSPRQNKLSYIVQIFKKKINNQLWIFHREERAYETVELVLM